MDLGPYLLFASLEGLVHAAVLSLIALGLSLVFGVMRIVNVAHGEFFMLGAILTWWVIPIMLIVGFLTPWPYNYWRLKKFGIACH